MKKIISKIWVKVLLVIISFIAFILLLGHCEKAKATNFILNDGTVSKVAYNDDLIIQRTTDSSNIQRMTIINTGDAYVITINETGSVGFVNTYFNCNYDITINTITCQNVFDSFGTIANLENYFVIAYDEIWHNTSFNTSQRYFVHYLWEDLESTQEKLIQAEIKWNNLLNYLNEKINFTDEEIGYVLEGAYNRSFDEKEEYLMELIERAWPNNMPSEEEIINLLLEIEYIFNEAWNNNLALINEKIGFTNEEFKNADYFGVIENTFSSAEEKSEYYNNLISQRWDSYLNENGTGGGYTEEDLEESYNQGVEDGKNSVDITIDNQEYANQEIREKIQNGELFREETLIQQAEYFANFLLEVETAWNNNLILIDEKINFLNEDIKNILNEDFYTGNEKYEYYANLINQKWGEYVNEVKVSVDITIDNQEYADKYIEDNNYHTNEEYLNYGEIKYSAGITYADSRVNTSSASYTAGQESVDIKTDNQEYADKYIEDNNYHTNEEYLNYGISQKREGYFNSFESFINTYNNYLDSNSYMPGVGYFCDTYTSGAYSCDVAYNSYLNDLNVKAKNSVDITTDNQEYADKYIEDNNYHTNEEYLNYGISQKREGYFNSFESFTNTYNNYLDSNSYMPGVGYFCETYTTGAYSCDDAYNGYLNDLNVKAKNSVDITTDNYLAFEEGVVEGKRLGYENANKEGKVLGTFVPNLLGGIGSFFLTILNIDFLGFNLLTLFGLFIAIGAIVLIIKFI